jgi:hypothetical protein
VWHGGRKRPCVRTRNLQTTAYRTSEGPYFWHPHSSSWLITIHDIYFFIRSSFVSFRCLQEGAVRRLAICEDGCESWIAYACDSGAVGIILLDRGSEEIDASWPPLALKSTPLCIVWAPSSSSSPSSDCDEDEETCTKCLFVGDSQGQVCVYFS